MAIQYSIQKMVSDGTLSTIALGIQYLQRNDIYIRIAGVETPQSGAHSSYTWSFINNTTLRILPVVPNGVEVVVYRRTDVDAMYNIYSQNAQFDEATIDENNQQLLYIAQEYLEQGIPGAGVDTLEYVRDDGSFTYYRMRRTDGSYSEEFPVPSASSSTKVLARESIRRSYAEASYNLVDGSFEAGGTLVNVNDVLLHEASGKAFTGPTGTVDAGTNPASGGFDDESDVIFSANLASSISSRAKIVTKVTETDTMVEAIAIATNRGLLPNKYAVKWQEPLAGAAYPQALAESENYYFITEDDGTGSQYNSRIYRINKITGVKSSGSQYVGSHGQGIGVISDDVVFIGGTSNSKIYTHNFSTGTGVETTCTGLYKDFPFCYDHETNRIYQLQDADGTSGFITRLVVLDKDTGFVGDTSVPLAVVKGGYPQAIAYSGGQIFITSGNSWSASTGGAWNDFWVLYKISVGGEILDSMKFRRTSMGLPLGFPSLTQHEPQGISIRNGKISLLQLFDPGSGVVSAIYLEDMGGVSVRSVPRNAFHVYNGLTDIGVNIASLSAGSAIKTIAESMSDGTSVSFSISGESWTSNDLGISLGVCTVTKINKFRVVAQAFECSSELIANATAKACTVSVYNAVQSKPRLIQGESNVLSAGYTGPGTIAAPGPIAIANAKLVGNWIFHVASTQNGPASTFKFSRGEINGYISSGAQVVIFSGVNTIAMSFSETGVNVLSVSGTPYLRYVFTN